MASRTNVVATLQAIVVLGGALAAVIFVPDSVLTPLAVVLLGVGGAGLLGVKKYIERLHEQGTLDQPGRRQFLEEVGMAFGLVALASFLVLVFLFSD